MTDAPPPPGPPSAPAGGGGFCGECGARLEPGAAFCGSCGAATSAAAASEAAAEAGGPPPGASDWTGVQPVVERPGDARPDRDEALNPPLPPPVSSAAPMPGLAPPPPGGPPAGPGGSRGRGPLIALALVVLAALAAGAVFLFGGDDDDDVGSDETTTTEEADETTTTEEPEETTTTAPDDGTTTTVTVPGVEFVSLTDSTGRLTVEVPADWTDVSLALEGAGDLANIQASTDLEAFRTAFEVPGMSFSLFPTPPADGNFDQVLDFLAGSVNLPNACVSSGKQDYDDGVFVGRFEVWQECAGVGTQIVLIVASQADGRTIEINVQLPEGEPIEIAQHIAETFFIVG